MWFHSFIHLHLLIHIFQNTHANSFQILMSILNDYLHEVAAPLLSFHIVERARPSFHIVERTTSKTRNFVSDFFSSNFSILT